MTRSPLDVRALAVTAGLAGTVWVGAVAPVTRPWIGALAVFAGLALAAVRGHTWLEPAEDGRPATLVRRLTWGPARRVPLTEGSTVELVHRGPTAVLRARGPAGRWLRLTLAVGGAHGRSRDSVELRALADAVGTPGLRGGRVLATVLRAQAEHADAGRPVRDSPVFGDGRAGSTPLRRPLQRTTGSSGART